MQPEHGLEVPHMHNADKIPVEYHTKGTRFVPLPALSASEKGEFIAQIRKLTSRYLQLFTAHHEAWEKIQEAGRGKKEGEEWEPSPELTIQALERAREMMNPAIVRVFEINGEKVIPYKVVDTPIGEHEPTEISIDLLEQDCGSLTIAISTLATGTGVDPEGTFRTEQGNDADAGQPGEAVQQDA